MLVLLRHELSLTAKLRIRESLRWLTLERWLTKAMLLLIVLSSRLLPSSKLAHPRVLRIPLASSLWRHEALWMLWKSLGIKLLLLTFLALLNSPGLLLSKLLRYESWLWWLLCS